MTQRIARLATEEEQYYIEQLQRFYDTACRHSDFKQMTSISEKLERAIDALATDNHKAAK